MPIPADLSKKKLLITGGTGSFGNAVLRRYLGSDIAEIRIFSRDEKKQDDMRHEYHDGRIKYYIGDVRNPDSIASRPAGRGLRVPRRGPQAGAVVRVLSGGVGAHQRPGRLQRAQRRASSEGVKKMVCLSTDKAVYPINAMGISKAMMEKVAVAESRNLDEGQTTMVVTRYGNVMASRGSVIPLFLDQIRAGEPLTVTDPTMTRFLMHLDVAVELVEFAFEHGRNGDTFIRKSPAATIGDSGPGDAWSCCGVDNPIKVIGGRHGEKLYETLLSREEMVRAEDMGGSSGSRPIRGT